MVRVGLLGCGEIGQSIVDALTNEPIAGVELGLLICRRHQLSSLKALAGSARIREEWTDDAAAGLDIVVEAAGQQALREIGPEILATGRDLYVLSVGALADDRFREELTAVAAKAGARIVLPAGALAGFDGLKSMRHAGLTSVTYRSIKPPRAWKGTPADAEFDLDEMTTATLLFAGSAREAALRYPKNANLAAAVALAGLGLDETRVELVADPAIVGNSGRIHAVSAAGRLDVDLTGDGFAGNPKSSRITGMSVLASLVNRTSTVTFAA